MSLSNATFRVHPSSSQPVWFTLPSSFEAAEFLRPLALAPYLDDARYFVSLIIRKSINQDQDDPFVVLHADFLRRVMNFRNYSQVIGALRSGGVVHRRGFRKGERSFGYRLDERFAADKHVRVQATDKKLIERIWLARRRHQHERLARMKPVHHALARQQQRLRIDEDLAGAILANLPLALNTFDVQGILVWDIRHREFHLEVGNYGRVSNNITSLKREVRPALRVDGQALAHIDLSCAQPALLARAMRAPINSRRGGRAGRTHQSPAQLSRRG